MRKIICDRCGADAEGRQLGPADGWYEHVFKGKGYIDLCQECEKSYNKYEEMARKQYDRAVEYWLKKPFKTEK